jgi:hypothetical protein
VIVATLILGNGLFTPDLIAGDLSGNVLVETFSGAGRGLPDRSSGSLDVTWIGCNASVAKGSVRPLATVFAQFSPLVGGIKPAASTAAALAPGVLVDAAKSGVGAVVVADAVVGAGVVAGAAATGVGAGLTAAVGLAAGVVAVGLLSPQADMRIAKLPTAPK